MSTDRRQILGKMGEDLACCELQRRGYAVLARRYRSRHGEIDIVARDGPAVVFVEVKARRGGAFGGGGAAVTAWKQRRLVRMAGEFVARHRLHDTPCRFDVVAIDFEGGRPTIEVYTNAFTA
ncbi:MAG: YraN family protein [Acidobacteria bacterium]|nr:YraN family protein [Acidobacteriota bacterium]